MENAWTKNLKDMQVLFLNSRTDEFCNQLNSIMLAVELLKNSANHWKESDQQYFHYLTTAVESMTELVRSCPVLIGVDEESLYDYLDNLGLAWWIEILTTSPRVTYYFGPFVTAQEAQIASGGYIEDLEKEGSQVLTVQIHQCQPHCLTIFENELGENSEWGTIQVFNPQIN